MIDGKSVNAIGYKAFLGKSLTSVIVSEGIKKIESQAFLSNRTNSFSLPTKLTSLSGEAFKFNNLQQENEFLYKRNSGGSIDYTKLVGYAGESRDIKIPGEKNGIELKTISANIFHTYSLTNVEIPHTITSIGNQAFCVNNIGNLIIPESVKKIALQHF